MKQHEIIIIGAGPAGLMAAYELAKNGRKALILEARARIGGRAHTLEDGTELGAEFIHGELPITLELLREAGITHTPISGEWVQLRGGEASEAFDSEPWPCMMRKLKALEKDMSLQDFLTQYFPETEYAALKDTAISYAEGYDTADTARVSAKALYEEWSAQQEEQSRIDGGYAGLMNFLADKITSFGSRILLNHPVSAVSIGNEGVNVVAVGQQFHARHVIIALPLGVLQSEDVLQIAAPSRAAYKAAVATLGFGDIIKFVLHFRNAFWETSCPGLGFLLSSAPVPTWWTQSPKQNGVFTGWLSGRIAQSHAAMPDEQLLDLALSSLAQIFNKEQRELESLLDEAHVANWSADIYTRGSYAYATVGAGTALQLLAKPLNGRVHFTGEYMYAGPAMGTVEAAFWSGQKVARCVGAFEPKT